MLRWNRRWQSLTFLINYRQISQKNYSLFFLTQWQFYSWPTCFCHWHTFGQEKPIVFGFVFWKLSRKFTFSAYNILGKTKWCHWITKHKAKRSRQEKGPPLIIFNYQYSQFHWHKQQKVLCVKWFTFYSCQRCVLSYKITSIGLAVSINI